MKKALQSPGLGVDYNLTGPEVYKEFVDWCIREEQSLDVLAQQRYKSGRDWRVNTSSTGLILPSWATDWSEGSGSLNFKTTENSPLGERLRYTDRAPALHPPVYGRNGDALIIWGFMIDTFKEPVLPSFYYDSDLQKRWRSAIPEDLNQETQLLFNRGHPSSAILRIVEKFPNTPYLWRDGTALAIPRSTKYTRTLITQKGCLAVTFAHMNYEKKPIVCALYGARALFILQPVLGIASEVSCYTLVCEDCFIDGFEDGKGIEKAKKLGLQEMAFRII